MVGACGGETPDAVPDSGRAARRACRVGLEDSLFIERRVAATSNAQQVSKIVRILHEMGHEPASPAEARAMPGLKGGDRVEF